MDLECRADRCAPPLAAARHDLPFAELMVFLQDANSVDCASNSPDRPIWPPFRASHWETITITGFQVGRLPCPCRQDSRLLHTRNDRHLNTPPPADLIAAEATIPASFTIR